MNMNTVRAAVGAVSRRFTLSTVLQSCNNINITGCYFTDFTDCGSSLLVSSETHSRDWNILDDGRLSRISDSWAGRQGSEDGRKQNYLNGKHQIVVYPLIIISFKYITFRYNGDCRPNLTYSQRYSIAAKHEM